MARGLCCSQSGGRDSGRGPAGRHVWKGRNFEPQLFSEFCQQLGILKRRTTPLHPQSNGFGEWYNRTLATQLALCVSQDQKDWDLQLPLVLLDTRECGTGDNWVYTSASHAGLRTENPNFLANGAHIRCTTWVRVCLSVTGPATVSP